MHAQEPARYRITYECHAQIVTGKPDTYRWTLDIGDSTAAFYNNNYRLYSHDMAELRASGDFTALTNQLPILGQKYPAKNDLQLIIGQPARGRYTYYKQVLTSGLKYEEPLPSIAWQLTDSTTTICEYECRQAVATVYGRTWTAWYAPELPLSYGPYILGGLPGLIMGARDADGLFDFRAIGIEHAPKDAVIAAYDEKAYQKCSRKRFLEIRADSEGLNKDQLVDRIMNQNTAGQKVIVYSIPGVKAQANAEVEVPRYNHLDRP